MNLLQNYIYFGIHCLWYSFPLLSNTKSNKHNKLILFLFYATIVILDTTIQESLYIQNSNSRILTAVFIMLFEFYNLIEAHKIVMQAKFHIMEIMM